jgi:SM-20-related protein
MQILTSSHEQETEQDPSQNRQLFNTITTDLLTQGYSIHTNVLSLTLAESLWQYVKGMPEQAFDPAGIGRENVHHLNQSVRSNQILWIDDSFDEGKHWLEWTSALQTFLNRRLFLGLFSFESHFAHYRVGDFYKKHLDTFKGESNRVLSLVYYLNKSWQSTDAGELVLYPEEDAPAITVKPEFGTLVLFLSEDIPHEVLPTQRDRYSIAGWYRVNTSTTERADPPL